jgi:hypothetical protein
MRADAHARAGVVAGGGPTPAAAAVAAATGAGGVKKMSFLKSRAPAAAAPVEANEEVSWLNDSPF